MLNPVKNRKLTRSLARSLTRAQRYTRALTRVCIQIVNPTRVHACSRTMSRILPKVSVPPEKFKAVFPNLKPTAYNDTNASRGVAK